MDSEYTNKQQQHLPHQVGGVQQSSTYPGIKGKNDKDTKTKVFTFGKCHQGNVLVHLDQENNLEFHAGGSTRGVALMEGAIHIDLANVWKPVLMSNCGFVLKYARKYDFVNLGWKDYDAGSLEKNEWTEIVAFLKERGKAHKKGPQKVLVACMGGHGRTGSCLSILAGLLGWTKEDPVRWIREHYCDKVVESDKQIQQIEAYTGLKVKVKPAKDSFTSGPSAFTKAGERYAMPDDAICQDVVCKHRGYAHSQMSGSCLLTMCACRMMDMGGVDYKPPIEKVDAESRDFTAINKSGGLMLCPPHLKSRTQPKSPKVKGRGAGPKPQADSTTSIAGFTAGEEGKNNEKHGDTKICGDCGCAGYMHRLFGRGSCYASACKCKAYVDWPEENETDQVGADSISDTVMDPTLNDLPVTFSSRSYWWCTFCLCAIAKPHVCTYCGKSRDHYQAEASKLLTGRR